MTNKTYLITGAAEGLGSELAQILCAQGHQVIGLDKQQQKLNLLYDHIETQSPETFHLYPFDLLGAAPEDYEQLATAIEQNFPEGLDGLILNAASFPAFTPIQHFDIKQWYEVLQTNLNANFHLIQALLPHLLKAKGQIAAIGDLACEQTPAYMGSYAVAKAGLKQLIFSLSQEHCEKCLQCIWLETRDFASESHLRMFPGKNPNEIPSQKDVAEFVFKALNECLEGQTQHNSEIGTAIRYTNKLDQ